MKLYVIKTNGKKTVRKVFYTYEEARSYVRKLIRKQDPWYSLEFTNRNPNILDYGYSIEQL